MAQVPYQPVPEVNPSDQGVHLGEAPAIPNAFGLNISKAVEGFGGTLEHSGTELANRALAIQHDKNVADADAADVELMKQIGLEHAQFNAKEGKERADGLAAHIEKLEQIRANVRNQLTNVDARNMYDRQSRNTLGRTIFNAAGAAASGQRQYEKQSNEAWLGSAIEQYSNDPTPARLEAIGQSARQLAAKNSGGTTDDIVADEAAKKVMSHAVLQRIKSISPHDPEAGNKFKEDNWDTLTATDKDAADKYVTQQARSVGTDRIADKVFQENQETPEKKGASLKEVEDKARAAAEKQFPGDVTAAQHAVAKVGTLWTKAHQAQRQEDLDNQRIVWEEVKKTGAKSANELSEKGRIALEALPATMQRVLPTQIRNYWESANYDDSHEAARQLKGLANNDLRKFVETDFTDSKFKLSQRQIDDLTNLKNRLVAKPTNDPRVNTALETMRGSHAAELEALGIFRRTQVNKDDYDHYTGMLQQAIDSWQEDKGKPPTQKEISETIGPQIIQQRTVPGFFGMLFGGNRKAFFNLDTSDEHFQNFITTQKELATKENRPEPSDELLYRAYQRMQYIKYHGAKKGDLNAQ